jgi:hypothetical protein
MEYVRSLLSPGRGLCWWCQFRPRRDEEGWTLCRNRLDWKRAVEVKNCGGFTPDEKRLPVRKEPAYRRVETEQLRVDAAGE